MRAGEQRDALGVLPGQYRGEAPALAVFRLERGGAVGGIERRVRVFPFPARDVVPRLVQSVHTFPIYPPIDAVASRQCRAVDFDGPGSSFWCTAELDHAP